MSVMYKRILAIGDIHGEWDKFLSVYDKIAFNPPEDLLVFVGDYVDRGPKPLEVLDWMTAHAEDPNIVMLRGNHDQLMLDYYMSKEAQKARGWIVPEQHYGDKWLDNGGDETKYLLEQRKRSGSPEEYAAFLERCLTFLGSRPLWFRIQAGGRDFFFCHAGVKADVPLDQQDPHDLLWMRYDFFMRFNEMEDKKSGPVVVAGHSPVPYIRSGLDKGDKNLPVIHDNMILVDTGACLDGRLSCVDVLSGQIWQSDK